MLLILSGLGRHVKYSSGKKIQDDSQNARVTFSFRITSGYFSNTREIRSVFANQTLIS